MTEPPDDLARTDEADVDAADGDMTEDTTTNETAADKTTPLRTKASAPVARKTPPGKAESAVKSAKADKKAGTTDKKTKPDKKAETSKKADTDKKAETSKKADTSAKTAVADGSSSRRIWWWAAAVIGFVVLPLVALGIFFAVDADRNTVARGVRFDGEDLSLVDVDEIEPLVQARADRFAATPVEVMTPQGPASLTAADIGLAVDVDKTIADVRGARTADGGLGRFTSWIGSFSGSTDVDLTLERPDDETIRTAFDRLDSDLEFPPSEPVLRGGIDGFELEPAVAGQEIATEALADQLPASLARVGSPIELDAELTLLPTQIAGDQAEQATAELNELTGDSLTVRALGEVHTAHPGTLRRWIDAELTEDGYDLSIDDDAVMKFVDSRFVALDRPGQDATFTVVDGEPEIIAPTFDGITCCADDSPELVLQALEDGESFVRLQTTPNPSSRDLEWAESMGVVELIGEFTSRHACCQGRVTNIQRIADLTRGAFIEPGELFSLNDHVGKRTREKGFVGGGVIYNGEFAEDIGGGISQFVTTMFNAAFFGGLDFGEYQSHSKYISRYPYGREATISWRRPEFEIINTTPHGVLVWTEYTSNSITVKLYSTAYAAGEQTGQSTYTHGLCKDVTTERTRTYVDGRVEVDTVMAFYREGKSGRC